MKNTKKCCLLEPLGSSKKGVSHQSDLFRVNRIKGQVEGIGRMIEEKAYCPHIITQIQAVRSALASLQATVLQAHLAHCVKSGLKRGSDKEADELVGELIGIFKHIG
jgi:CsoR family transcriptional regulator, copper-sensing transcriptional repressor